MGHFSDTTGDSNLKISDKKWSDGSFTDEATAVWKLFMRYYFMRDAPDIFVVEVSDDVQYCWHWLSDWGHVQLSDGDRERSRLLKRT